MINISFDIRFIPINQISDFEKVEYLWKKNQCGEEMTVFQSYEWNRQLFVEWFNFKYNKISSSIEICLVKNAENVMIVPLLIQKHCTYAKWIGRKRGIYILGHGSYSDYLNFIYRDFSEELLDCMINEIKNRYKGLRFLISDVREDTSCFKYLSNKYQIVFENISVAVMIENNAADYTALLSKHTRQNLRTAQNRMNKDNMEYEWETFGIIDNADLLETLLAIHMKRIITKSQSNEDIIHKVYGKISSFFINYKEKNNNIVYRSMQTMNNSMTIIVKLKGNVVGYIYGLKEQDGVIRVIQNCVNEEYKFYSPMIRGIYDFIMVCCENNEVKEIDFTRGDEDYKYKLGGVETKLYTFEL